MAKSSDKAAKPKVAAKESAQSGANLGFEAKLWLAAGKLRYNMDAAEYKHVVLGFIFLKYISDTSAEHHAKLVAGKGDCAGANPEDKDEYKAENVFWVPKEACRAHLQALTVGGVVDDAVFAIERDKPRLKGVPPKEYARPGLDKHPLGELTDLIGTIGPGDRDNRAKDTLAMLRDMLLPKLLSGELSVSSVRHQPRGAA
jgi:type I restriction enzyme M protein